MFDLLFGSTLVQNLSLMIQQFHFIRPLWLLLFIPMLLLIYLRWQQDSQQVWQSILPAHLRAVLTIGERGWKKQLPLKLLTLCIALSIVVCAGPSWQKEPSPFGEDKASLLVVLDNSQSMLETDLAPSRIERSKQKIQDLMTLRAGGGTGLIAYAGSAHLAMPITQDNQVFAPFLAAIDPDIMPISGKHAEKALPLIEQQLKGDVGSSVLLISDGVTPQSIDAYAQFFSENPYQLIILAAGNPNVESRSPADFTSLRSLARATQGQLIEVSVDTRDIQAIERAIERNMQLNGDSSMPWQDMGYWLLIPIATLMLLWFRKGWLVQWCLIAMISWPAMMPNVAHASPDKTDQPVTVVEKTSLDKLNQWWMDLWFTPDQQGQRLFDQQRYLEAAKAFDDLERKGVAYYYAREYRLAHSVFIQMDSDLGTYYAATSLARQREYLAARNLLKNMFESRVLSTTLTKKVINNLDVLNGLIDEINRLSESQMNTTEGPEESFELGDNPQTGDGAEEQVTEEYLMRESLNANEILGSEELANMWLQRVEADPKFFLQAKFHIQLQAPTSSMQHNVGQNDD
ncbi:VWA domain-containing protein [Vibrio lamellibrachiae]|uniref:vWA domain-containing protein n=1 Tax=Vibrio lamellibrachiae TaxID=2910253 RepID=UPI003D126BBB